MSNYIYIFHIMDISSEVTLLTRLNFESGPLRRLVMHTAHCVAGIKKYIYEYGHGNVNNNNNYNNDDERDD